jgi:hypothetical protein
VTACEEGDHKKIYNVLFTYDNLGDVFLDLLINGENYGI